jgi:hypothetical protein
MTNWQDIENHMVLGDYPDDTNEVISDVTVSCCNCNKSEELAFIINEDWEDKELDEYVSDYFYPGKIYCENCFYQVENVLPQQEVLDAHLLWELAEFKSSPIELYNQAEYEQAQKDWYIDNQYDMMKEEELFND